MSAEIAKLREIVFDAIGHHPRDCCSFVGLRTMEGTAFFPGGDGLWKPNANIDPILPIGGLPFLGSDWGDRESYGTGGESEAIGSAGGQNSGDNTSSIGQGHSSGSDPEPVEGRPV